MSNPNRDASWALAENEEDDFVLEEDDTFGLGDIEGGLPPFDAGDMPAPSLEQDNSALSEEDPFGLSALAPAAPLLASSEGKVTEQPVPRITIHATCDRPEISDVIAGIAADRRMARAEITVEPGGIDAAVTRFSAQA